VQPRGGGGDAQGTLNPDPKTPNPKPQTLNPKPQTLNPKELLDEWLEERLDHRGRTITGFRRQPIARSGGGGGSDRREGAGGDDSRVREGCVTRGSFDEL